MPRHTRMTRSGPRPRYAWVPGVIPLSGVSGGVATTADLIANYLIDAGRDTGPGMVIERVLGNIVVNSQTLGVTSQWEAGLIVVPEGGRASSPALDIEVEPWLWWHGDMAPTDTYEISDLVFIKGQLRINFDVKSRRRLAGMGDELRMVVKSVASPGIDFAVHTRTLLRTS